MKKTLSSLVLGALAISLLTPQVSANISSANTLASQGVISQAADYRLGDTITRKETLKIVMNLSGKNVPDTCNGIFSDVSNDWGCKYIEAALANGFIAANATFRPDDTITKAESIKLILAARGISKATDTGDWQADWMNTAYDNSLLETKYSDHNTAALRGWIFQLGANPIIARSTNEAPVTVVETTPAPASEPVVKASPAVIPKPVSEPTPEPVVEVIPEPTRPVTLSSGSFSTISSTTSGTIKLVNTNGKNTLELSNFSTKSAPDLFIYLSPNSSISSSKDVVGALRLAPLQSSSGNQTYEIPADVDLSLYKSAAIHCREYNATFGSASLR